MSAKKLQIQSSNFKLCAECQKRWNEHPNRRHGFSKTPLYRVWQGIKRRCYNKNEIVYKHYGGRGIVMSDEWKRSFLNFKRDMESTYEKGMEIERINVNGNYTKNNCRWATRIEQVNNTRSNKFITFEGKRLTVTQWERKLGIPIGRVKHRINRLHWTPEKALTEPKRINQFV